ncbi:MAG: hypothetical protein K8T90_01275 [Planctomycetes bacterium]|nr:hypothetical protein [Planctomycetota bacterium]
MTVDLTSAYAALLARNLGPVPGDSEARRPAEYGVSAAFDRGVVYLTLTFRSGAAYCCYEWGCHLGLDEVETWPWLRGELAARGVASPGLLRVRLTVVVEAGALFFDWTRPRPSARGRGWYEFAPEAARRYEEVFTEGDEDVDAAEEPPPGAQMGLIDRRVLPPFS